jgi:hypothetical protein
MQQHPTLQGNDDMKNKTIYSTRLIKSVVDSNPPELRDQTQEQSDRIVNLAILRCREFEEARARGDVRAAERAMTALTGILLMWFHRPEAAVRILRDYAEWQNFKELDVFLTKILPREVTMYQVMDRARRSLAAKLQRGETIGVKDTQAELVGALLACGLPVEKAFAQRDFLVKQAIEALQFT